MEFHCEPSLFLNVDTKKQGCCAVYVMAVKDYQFKDHGLFPNYYVVPKIADKINGNDLELEFAKKLINK